ncbi:hypothetical protein [Micromonospora thermarum]|uniref:4Fe-4S Wbl-type domain-containing protein n=1 Tax=Micromonospora thermarum TaxID=2720024 RepID=A0ABX0ZDB0_9ACTN|nr:hypothetical protein [Micromonospora thermarum]NJP35214.1 hypothetical protein [Micromonospora thermarum]
MSGVRATFAAQALAGPEAARQVIDQHLRSDVGGRCLACGELEPCPQRDTAHAVLFGHARQLPRRRPMELIGTRADFAGPGASTFDAFGQAE